MTDALAAPSGDSAPAAPPPALTAAEIEALIERKSQELSDRRISGLQSMYDGKLARLQAELTKVQRASLSASEIADLDSEDVKAELAKARRELEAYRKAQEYPDAFPVYSKLLSAETPEEQLTVLSEALALRSVPSAPQAPAQAAAPAERTPRVDPNNPRNEDLSGVMTDRVAAEILASFGEWPTG